MRQSKHMSGTNRIRIRAIVLLLGFACPVLGAQANNTLSLDEAVSRALESNPGVESAHWDWLAANAKADAANWRKLPSVVLGAGYQKLNEVPAGSITVPGIGSFSLPSSLTDVFTFSVNLQYPVFAGFRISESARIAELQARGKEIAEEMVRRALVFEVRRAYWEAVRAASNVNLLRKNLELARMNSTLTAKQLSQGVATEADKLAADSRYLQAQLDLDNAVTLEKRAYLVLSSLTGNNAPDIAMVPGSGETAPPYILSTKPGDQVQPAIGNPPEEKALIAEALSKRPETRGAELSVNIAKRSLGLAQAALYPTLVLTGNYTYASPNQRVPFQTNPGEFTGTWAVGVQLSYDIGGIPAVLAESNAQSENIRKTEAEAEKQMNQVILDVRMTLLNLEQSRHDLTLTRGMVGQAEENLRVLQQRYAAGAARETDVLNAQVNLLRVNFAVLNKEIDILIASADLARATATEEMK